MGMQPNTAVANALKLAEQEFTELVDFDFQIPHKLTQFKTSTKSFWQKCKTKLAIASYAVKAMGMKDRSRTDDDFNPDFNLDVHASTKIATRTVLIPRNRDDTMLSLGLWFQRVRTGMLCLECSTYVFGDALYGCALSRTC